MTGIVDLDELLKTMSPALRGGEYVFCSVEGSHRDYAHLNPLATFTEAEGVTLILPVEEARGAGMDYEGLFRQITLTVHSSLEAVGLTAAVAAKLASVDISANVVAAYYHDHVFVPADKADLALEALVSVTG